MQRYAAFKSLAIPRNGGILRFPTNGSILPISSEVSFCKLLILSRLKIQKKHFWSRFLLGNSIRFSSAWKIAASKAEFLAKKTLFGANRKPLIPKFITFIPYIAHLFIRMKIIEKDISNLYAKLITNKKKNYE